MVGQKKLLEKIDSLQHFPSSVLLVGNKGCEQLEVLKYIADKFNLQLVIIEDVSVDNIRNTIKMAYNINSNILYAIINADDMSIAAKNSMLKIMEEPVNNSKFIFLLEDEQSTLYTIRSRSVIYYMDNYTLDELRGYYKQTDKYNEDYRNIIFQVCHTPGDVDILCKYDIEEFYTFVHKVIDIIDIVSGSNCFKIADRVALKNEEDKYDLRLFWNAFISMCDEKVWSNPEKYKAGIFTTAKCLQQLRNKSINKQMLFDEWILSIRAEWRAID